MITLGYITKLNETDGNLFEVRIPIFEKAGSSKELPDLSGSYFQATVNQVPGQYNAYQVGDCVVIGFLDNHYEKPIILGKLYLGNTPDKIKPQGFLDANALEVSDKAVLPGNTTIGEIGYRDLEKLLRAIETLGGQITTVADNGGGSGTDLDTTVGIILGLTTNINGRELTNFTVANGGNPEIINDYPAYRLLYNGSNVTKDQAAIYMENMVGNTYVPVYDFYKPKNTYLIVYSLIASNPLNGLIVKPQWDDTNGLLLYLMKNIDVAANPSVTSSAPVLSSIRIGGYNYRLSSGGGGGSEVIPNPDTPTPQDRLYEVQIDGAKFIVGNIGLTPYVIDPDNGPILVTD